MLFGFPWWAWVIVFALFWVLPSLAQNYFRQTVQGELIKYLRLHHPGVTITSRNYVALQLRSGETTAELDMAQITKAVAETRPLTPESRDAVFARFCAPFAAAAPEVPVSRESHGNRILPRLVDMAFLNAVPERSLLPMRALGFTGLSVVYLLDDPQLVTFVTREQSEALGLDDRQLHELALENLRSRTEISSFEPGRHALTVFQNEDGHDPARVLLLPAVLPEGEMLVAAIPSPNTLVLAPGPTDGDWATWNGLHQTGEAVGDRALRVTNHGVEAAPLD